MNENLIQNHFNFILNTLVFCAIGFVIPGFTAIILLGIQIIFTKIGIECSSAWKIIWILNWIGMVVLPYLFLQYIKIIPEEKLPLLKSRLIFFNLLEYIFIQASLASFFTSGQTLCYVSDGQNGIELVFTAWLALPILFSFSLYFSRISMIKKQDTTANSR